MTSGRTVVLGLVVLTTAAFTLVLTQSSREDGSVRLGVRTADATCEPTAKEPCMPQLTYVDTDGTTWTPEQLAGKVVIINFWATWCGPCVQEIPLLAEAYAQHRDHGLVILGLLADRVDDAQLTSFADSTGVNYPIVRVESDMMSAFGYPQGLPTTFVYDRSGHLQLRHVGPLGPRHFERIAPLLDAN